jgi:hypothetical protein
MKTGEKKVNDIKAVHVQLKGNKGTVPGISMIISLPRDPSIKRSEIVFTLNELKKMVKECEKI